MYVRIFQGVETNKKYTIAYDPNPTMINCGALTIENENKLRILVDEKELYECIDNFFKIKAGIRG